MHNIFVPFVTLNTVKSLKRFLTTFGMTSFLCNFQICSFIDNNKQKPTARRSSARELKLSRNRPWVHTRWRQRAKVENILW